MDRPPFPLYFSLSHGGDLVLIGVAAAPVGVDVEAVPTPGTALTDRAEVFARLWARREAYLEGLGTGPARDPAADYLGTEGRAAPLSGWTITDVPAGAGHAAAAAVRGLLRTARLHHLPAGVVQGVADATG